MLHRALASAVPPFLAGPGERPHDAAGGWAWAAAWATARGHARRVPAGPIRFVLLWLLAIAIRVPFIQAVPSVAGVVPDGMQALPVEVWGWRLPTSPLAAAIPDALARALASVIGPSPVLPRLVAALLAAATVPLAYGLARELVRPVGRRRLEDEFAGPRLAGLLGALLLATSAAHVVIAGHVPGAPAIAPLLFVAALFALERALAVRDGRWLVAGGLLLGLALQSGPTAWVLVPGMAFALWRVGRGLMLSRWGAAGLLAFLAACGPLLAVLLRGDADRTSDARGGDAAALGRGGALASRADGILSPVGAYVEMLGADLLLLSRLLAGQLGGTPPGDEVFAGALAWPYAGLALLGLAILILRGRPLLPFAALSGVLALPLLGPSVGLTEGPVAGGPGMLPLLMVLVAIGIVASGAALGTLAPLVSRRGSVARLLVGMALLALVLAPLPRLYGYYAEYGGHGTGASVPAGYHRVGDAESGPRSAADRAGR